MTAKARPTKRASRRPPPPVEDPPAPGSLTLSLKEALDEVEKVRALIAGMHDTARRLGI